MALTLLRHGALPQYYHDRYNGWSDMSIDPSLFETDKVALLQKQKFDFVYSSDLSRCMQTLEMMDIEEYFQDTRLREVRFKEEIEGKNFNEIEKLPSYQSHYIEDKQKWHNYICDEHPLLFEARIKSFLTDLPKGKEILICSHGGTLQKMIALLGYTKHKIEYLEWIRIENVI